MCQNSNSAFILHQNEASVIVVSVRTLYIGVRGWKCIWNLQGSKYIPPRGITSHMQITMGHHLRVSLLLFIQFPTPKLVIATSISTPVTPDLGFYNTAWRDQPDFIPKRCTIVVCWVGVGVVKTKYNSRRIGSGENIIIALNCRFDDTST